MPAPDEPRTDRELLEHHRTGGDARAFSELARRHLGMVYSAALRVSGDAGAAEEISWAVFTRLAAARGALPAHVPVNAWLHRAVRSAALNHRRAEGRRRRREHTYATHRAMSDAPAVPPHDADPFPWEEIAPVLDEVLERLPAGERSVILSRFFAGRSHVEIAAELRLSADAARMRIHRALERMRGLLARRGIRTTASALAAALPAHGSVPVPAALAASVSAAFSLTAPPAAAAFGAASTHSVLTVIMAKKTTLTAAAALLLLTGAGTLLFYRNHPAEGASGAFARGGGPRVLTAAESPPGARPAPPVPAAGKGEGVAESPPPPAPWPDPEKLSRALREDIASSTVHTTLRAGETLVTGGYRGADGRHEITFLTPRAVTMEDGAAAVEVRAEIVFLNEEDVRLGGLESLATNARNTLQHAEAWGAPEVETLMARLREKATAAPGGEGGTRAEDGGSGIFAAPRIISRLSHSFSMMMGATMKDGMPVAADYTLEAVVEAGEDGAFDVKSRIERSLSPAAKQDDK